MTEDKMPDCRSCRNFVIGYESDWCESDEKPCVNGDQFERRNPIRLYTISEASQ